MSKSSVKMHTKWSVLCNKMHIQLAELPAAEPEHLCSLVGLLADKLRSDHKREERERERERERDHRQSRQL